MDAPWTALVIDDDAGVRQSLRLCLEAAGAKVLGVGTAKAALEILDRASFDVVYLDLWLGADSGMKLLPEIVRREAAGGIIVITAYASFETAVEAIRLGATDYLPKPFTPDQVRFAASRVLETRRLRGRVAELEAIVERTVPAEHGKVTAPSVGALVSLEELEREHIARVVLQTPTLEAAARVLGIDATTLQRKRRRFGLA